MKWDGGIALHFVSLLRLLILTKVNFFRISLRFAEPPNMFCFAKLPVAWIQTSSVMKIARPKGLTNFMAGMEGFEPPNTGTRNQRLTTWPHPNVPYFITP